MAENSKLSSALKEALKDSSPEEIEQILQKLTVAASPPTSYSESYFTGHATKYIDFTYTSPTIYHVVANFGTQLEKAGFKHLSETQSWADLQPGKYYTTRNGTNLAAFVVGPDWQPSHGIGAVGLHIDSLTVVLKPSSLKAQKEGYDLLGVAPYAGTLGDLWWDRDLGLGGRVLVRDGGKIVSKLVDSTPHPIAKIPTLAPHFGAPAVGPFNKETQAVPVVGFSIEEEPATAAEKKAPLYGKHSLSLLRYVAASLGVAVQDILSWDLQLYDVQKGAVGGLKNDLLFAPRVDDRICSYAALNALIETAQAGKVPADAFSIVALYDNEEVGSGTRQGARGGLLEAVVTRVVSLQYYGGEKPDDDLKVVYGNSIILSADVNHLVNPNFSDVYLEHHKPVPNTGVALALDPNGHMVTDAIGQALVEELGRINGDKIQRFQIRNDSRSGGTIGPYLATQTGARTIDLGIPQLSMHSIRATVGAKDVGLGTKFFAGFFAKWAEVYAQFDDL